MGATSMERDLRGLRTTRERRNGETLARAGALIHRPCHGPARSSRWAALFPCEARLGLGAQHGRERRRVIVPARAGLLRLGEEHPRRDAGEPDALAREVGLVCVAGAEGEQREPVVRRRAALRDRLLDEREEALERSIRCSTFGASPTAVRQRRRSCVSEM